MIAKFWQSGESPERSSSSLVVVVCTSAGRLPIQLSVETRTLPTGRSSSLTEHSILAYPESMPMQHIFCCCRRSPLASTDACHAR
jgi:hypothetical protein